MHIIYATNRGLEQRRVRGDDQSVLALPLHSGRTFNKLQRVLHKHRASWINGTHVDGGRSNAASLLLGELALRFASSPSRRLNRCGVGELSWTRAPLEEI